MQEHEFREQFTKLVFSKPPTEIVTDRFEKIMDANIVEFSKDDPANYGKAIAVYHAIVKSIADYWQPAFPNAKVARKVTAYLSKIKDEL